MRPVRRLLAALAVALGIVILSGCASTMSTDIQMDRHGRGTVTLTLQLDRDALGFLGLSADDPAAIATRFAPLLQEGGWAPAEGGESVQQNVFSFSSDDQGGVVLSTRKAFDNVEGLDAIVSQKRDLRLVPSSPEVLGSLADMPDSAPLINDFTFRLGTGTGDNPGFYVFGRGGVGEIGHHTCSGDRVENFSRTLRDSLRLNYSMRVPGGPGTTNATRVSNGAGVWEARFGDCPDLKAESGGGSSSTLVNGLVLGVLTGILILVFVARGVRRRRATPRAAGAETPAGGGRRRRGTSRAKGSPPPADDAASRE